MRTPSMRDHPGRRNPHPAARDRGRRAHGRDHGALRGVCRACVAEIVADQGPGQRAGGLLICGSLHLPASSSRRTGDRESAARAPTRPIRRACFSPMRPIFGSRHLAALEQGSSSECRARRICEGSAGFSSMLTLATLTRPSMSGGEVVEKRCDHLTGPHHSAQKSTARARFARKYHGVEARVADAVGFIRGILSLIRADIRGAGNPAVKEAPRPAFRRDMSDRVARPTARCWPMWISPPCSLAHVGHFSVVANQTPGRDWARRSVPR